MNRILAVDDEKNAVKALRRIFMDFDCELEVALDGREALACIPEFKPDIVLLDIMMPGINGYEVCRRIKTDPATASAMVMLVSARPNLADRMKGYEVQADDYITKPYDPEELRARVRILLRLKTSLDETITLNKNLEKLVEKRTQDLVKRERDAIIGRMVQGIVHNLQGPIMIISASASLAAGNIKTGNMANLSNNLDNIVKGVDRIEELIKSLLTKSRQDAVLEKQALQLNDLIAQEMEFLSSDPIVKYGIEKELSLDPSLPLIYGVPSDFSQIIDNLTKNAASAMKEKESGDKRLTISTTHDNESIYIMFKDTGSGISHYDMDRLFDPFFTTKSEPKNKGEHEGTGLGLYTCAELMKEYKGEITVKSELGKGAEFNVKIPKQGHIVEEKH
ncbi:MAG: hybrid sensor histidine kinase/response regulator [Pseudomonadota bacterium]